MDIYKRIQVQKLDAASIDSIYLLINSDNYYEANRNIVEILTCLQEEDNMDSAILKYQNNYRKDMSYDEITDIIIKKINPILKQSKTKSALIWHKEIINNETLKKYSAYLEKLFYWKYIFIVCSIALTLDVCFFIHTDNILNFNNIANIDILIGLLIFVFVSSLFHELGHATACTKKRISHGGIGIGLYLNFPILYTDVTAIWKLPRKDRCMVNIAGVYFQCFILIILLSLYYEYKNDIIRYMILTINFGILFTLNPFFKFDGYWIVSDLLGIPNLRKRSKEYIAYLFGAFPKSKKPYILKIRKRNRIIFVLYSLTVNMFMGYYFIYVIPYFLWNFFNDFPNEVHQLTLYLSCRITPSFTLIRNITSQLLLFALICYMLYSKMIKPINIKWKKKRH